MNFLKRISVDSLTGRTILILLFGIAVLFLDVMLVTSLIGQDEQGVLNWVIVITIELSGLIVIAYIISRQLIKPLKQLSDMAQRFSVDMHTAPLEIKGPIEVRNTTQSFNLMQQRIQRFVDERMQLIAAISHDLRTPLTRLRLRLDDLPDKQQQQKAFNDINEMQAMIDSTLAFIRDDSSKEQVTKIDLASLICTICNDSSDTFGPANYIGPNKCICSCKPIAIKRALSNLIENAIKYGEQAKVTLKCCDRKIKITIEDSGPGIPEKEFEQVFLPFYRIENSRNLETGGVGLGLSVSRTIIQSSGGEITLKNISEGGLLITVDLPSEN